jgi:hypothetical protein
LCRSSEAVGRTAEEAKARADGNDRPNGELVWANRAAADVIVPSYDWDGAAGGAAAEKVEEAEKEEKSKVETKVKVPYPSPRTYVVYDIEGIETTYNVLTPPPGGRRKDAVSGEPITVCAGDTVTVHAKGVVEETGKKFWSTKVGLYKLCPHSFVSIRWQTYWTEETPRHDR